MKRTTLIAIGVTAAALVLVPTVIAVAQAANTTPAATCPYHEAAAGAEMPYSTHGQTMMGQTGMAMMGQNGMGMMGQNGMGMMGQNGMVPEECPMGDDVQS